MLSHVPWPNFSMQRGKGLEHAESMVRIRDLLKHFGDLEVLKEVNLEILRTQMLVISEPSGSGKSTLPCCVNRLEEPTSGEIFIDGVLVNDTRLKQGFPEAPQPGSGSLLSRQNQMRFLSNPKKREPDSLWGRYQND